MSDEVPPPADETSPAAGGAGAAGAEGAEGTEGAPAPGSVAVAERPEAVPTEVSAAAHEADRRREARTSRLLLPLLLPIGAILAIGFFVLNVSRVFLAAEKGDSTVAVAIAAGITIAILGGATLFSAMPRARTSSVTLTVGVALLVLLLAGSIVLGTSEPEKKESAGYVEPTGPSINTLDVTALPTLKFDKKAYTAPAGINTINYIDGGGTHTFVFENAYPGFELQVPPTDKGKIDLKPGEYVFYCTIPGHRAAGMEATLTVTAGGATTTTGAAGG